MCGLTLFLFLEPLMGDPFFAWDALLTTSGDGMARTLLILGAVLLLLVGLLSNHIGSALDRHLSNLAPDPSNDRKKVYTVELASGLDYRLGAYPETRLLYFDECRIEKRKHGGFSFGALNILVIDQLEITLPPQAKRLFDDRPGEVGAAEIFPRKQVEKMFRRKRGQPAHCVIYGLLAADGWSSFLSWLGN